MKLACSKSDLLNGVSTVSRAVPNKTTMSILECILINANENSITLTANDMELGIETTIEGKVEVPGTVAIDARMFLDIVRSLPDNDIVVESDPSSFKTVITCEKAVFNISGKSGEDFSYLPVIEKKDSVSISQFTLKEVIRQTIFSVSDNNSNKIMCGEYFEINEDLMRVISLDGFRISVRRINLSDNYISRNVIIPGKTLNEISRIIPGDMDKDVTLYFDDNHVVFEFGNTMVVSRVIEGEYFHVDQMMSSDYEVRLKINRRELLNCIERSVLLVKEGNSKPVIMSIQDESMNLRINTALGSMNEDIDVEKTGKNMMIGFNPKYMIDALRVIDDDEVELYMMNSKSPCYIKDADESYNYMILPVNFTNI